MFQLLVMFALLFPRGLSLRCFNCEMAVTREACLANQVEKECGKGTLQPACLSLSYKTVKNNKDTVVFMKKCSELKYCQKLCNSGMIMDMENCKTNCCQSNGCNKNNFHHVVVIGGPKSKRSSNDPNQGATNGYNRIRGNELILLVTLAIVIFTKKNY